MVRFTLRLLWGRSLCERYGALNVSRRLAVLLARGVLSRESAPLRRLVLAGCALLLANVR